MTTSVGIKALRKIQGGAESTDASGTPVAATWLWRGMGVIDDQREVVFVDEDIGYLSGVDRTYIPRLAAALTMTDIEATFEQLPYIFEAGIEAEASTQDGAGSGYIYEYDFPTTAQNDIRTYTLEGGDNVESEEMEYSFVQNFNITGSAGEALFVNADWMGRQVSTADFTGAIAIPAVEEILFSKGKLYIDPSTDTIGTSLISNSLLSMDLSVNTGLVPVFTAEGNLYFSFIKTSADELEVLLDITFEHDSNSQAEKVNWRNESARIIRLLFEGSALGTTGTDYGVKSFIIDLAGKWENFEPLDDQDGNDILTGTFRARYNSDAALFGRMTVVNELSALT